MGYKVIGKIKNNGKTLGYELQDTYGNIKAFRNADIKKMIRSGYNIGGLKLDTLGRLRSIKEIEMYKSENGIDIETGSDLIKKSRALVGGFKPRWFTSDIVKFCTTEAYDRLFVIHGIRRTGKTVALRHVALELRKLGIDSRKIYLLTVSKEITFESLVDVLSRIRNSIVLIDEITRVKEVISMLHYLSDTLILNNRLKIVIAGTDSYVFQLESATTLFGRTIKCRSTILTYKEYLYLFGRTDESYKNYITDGSLYGRGAQTSAKIIESINSTTIANISNTIERNRNFLANNVLYSDLLRFNKHSISFLVYSILTTVVSPKKSNKLNLAIKVLGKNKARFLIQACNTVREKMPTCADGITNMDLEDLANILSSLDIIKIVPNFAEDTISDEQFERGYRPITDQEICVMNTGLLYSILDVLTTDDRIIDGSVLENLVLSQLYSLNGTQDYAITNIGYLKYKDNNSIQHEVDAVVRIRDTKLRHSYTLIEVKHSSSINRDFSKHLRDEILPENMVNSTLRKIVVYRGKTIKERGIHYVNIEDFLLDTWKFIV